MMKVDMHNHGLAPSALERMRREPERHGVTVTDVPGGVEVRFPDGPARRVEPSWSDLTERLEHLSAIGLDGAVLSTQIEFHRYTLPVPEGVTLMRTLNDGMAEWVAGETRLRAMASLPLQDGIAAAEELRRACQDLGLTGAMIATHVGPKNLDDPGLEPLWQAAEDLRQPIFIHPTDVLGKDRLSCYYLQNLLGNPFETTVAAASLIMAGVLDRHPDLTIVLAHGGGYLTLAFGRLTHGYTHIAGVDFRAAKPPTAYLQRFLYDTILYDPAPLQHLLKVAGVDRILLGTDYPFAMEPDGLLAMIDELGLAPEERERLLTNAARLYGF
jgi:aminocarboxymuconate-semialdehyde decarboxylase